MKTSPKGVELIKHFERYQPKALANSNGVMYYGYGAKRHYDGTTIKYGETITEKEAKDLLLHDLSFLEKRVSSHFKVVDQDQFDALMSFSYSVGFGFLLSSNLRKMILRNVKDEAIGLEWVKWSYDGKYKLRQLIKRRKAEYVLFSTGNLDFTNE